MRQDQSIQPDIANRIKAGQQTDNDILYIETRILEKEYADYKYQSNVDGKDFLNYDEWRKLADLKKIVEKYL